MARMSETHVAVVDDEPAITQLIADYLKSHGFRVSQLRGGNSLFALMATDPPALVLLDIGLGGEDGLAVARKLRAHWRRGLVIVTGRGDIVDRIVGLEVGADDYVAKPFDLRELVARIKAVLRRLQPDEADGLAPETECACFSFAGWSLDVGARRLAAPDTTEVLLTSGEFELLRAFAEHPGRVLSREFLLECTRGREAGPYDRTMDVQVGRLRRKIEADPVHPQIIKTVRSAGYVLVPPVSAD